MVKGRSDSETGNPLLAIYSFTVSISSKGSFMFAIPQTGLYKSKSWNTGLIEPPGARCSYIVRAFAHGGIDRRIDPS